MAPLLAAVASLLVIFSNIKPTASEDSALRNSSQCDDCCNKLSSHTAILNLIVSQQVTELLSLQEIKGKVVDDFPSSLEKLSTGLDVLTAAVTDDILSKLEKQSLSLNRIESLLINSTVRIDALYEKLQLLENRIKVPDQCCETLTPVVKEIHDFVFRPKDCSDLRTLGYNTSGVYRVYLGSLANQIHVDVYCDMTTPGGSWLVFQRRQDGSVDFFLNWSDYEAGFGNVTGEFWLGNKLLYLLTSNRKYKLRFDLEDFDGQKRYAEYSEFSIGSPDDRYRLKVSGYTGDAGDSFTIQNGMQFSTKDSDNDVAVGGKNCAVLFSGAWWYRSCHRSNLNGLYLGGNHASYADGIEWSTWHGQYYSLKAAEMKISRY